MTRPSKRPDSSFFTYRKRVPEDLRALVGKREIKISLRTRDPAEAKIANARMDAEVETGWAQLRRGVISVSQKQAVAMAGEIYRELVAGHENNPGEPGDWKGSLLIDWGFLRPEKNVKVHMMGTAPDESRKMFEKMRLNRHGQIVQDYLDRHGYRVDHESLVRIKKAANEAIMQGREQLLRNAEGDYRPDPDAGRFPELELGNEPAGHGDTLAERSSPLDVFDRYAKESKLEPATIKRWRPVVAKVQKENPYISGITQEWCIQWKNKLVGSGLSNNTIRNGYLASMRSLCNWAVANKEMASNPFKDVTVKADKKRKMRQKGFLDSEAQTILAATLVPAPDSFSPQHAAARRWVPWLCAYLGARVGEVGQLRGMDIKQEEGVWLVWITPDAGSTKNESARYVALHPHLIEQGFLKFVQKSGKGPLFYDPRRRRKGSEQNPQSKKIGERIAKWVRELGVDDPHILPNHAWRHRFKTVARKVHMDVGARDYMQGHVPATEGEAYGDFPPDVLLHEISKLPRIEIDADKAQAGPQLKPAANDEARIPA
jgi:integrase